MTEPLILLMLMLMLLLVPERTNAQRSTFNAQRSIQTVGRWMSGVECLALNVER